MLQGLVVCVSPAANRKRSKRAWDGPPCVCAASLSHPAATEPRTGLPPPLTVKGGWRQPLKVGGSKRWVASRLRCCLSRASVAASLFWLQRPSSSPKFWKRPCGRRPLVVRSSCITFVQSHRCASLLPRMLSGGRGWQAGWLRGLTHPVRSPHTHSTQASINPSIP